MACRSNMDSSFTVLVGRGRGCLSWAHIRIWAVIKKQIEHVKMELIRERRLLEEGRLNSYSGIN